MLIQETWCENEQDLKALQDKFSGFRCFTEKATRTSKFGRPSGGLAVYFKEKYANSVKRLDVGFKFGISLEIKALVNSTPPEMMNLILVCMYLPPENSTAYEAETDGVEVLKEKLVDLKSRFPNHRLVVAGDLNARIGSLQDYFDDRVDHIPGMNWYTPDNFDVPRSSKDNVVNNFGQNLIDVCSELDIRVLNGRTSNDCPGQYTNICEAGCSTVDYIIVETSLYESVARFEVGELIVSNHMPVQCILNLQVETNPENRNIMYPSIELSQQCKFRWENELRGQVSAAMHDNTTTTALIVEESDQVNIDEAVDIFESMLHRAAEPMKVNTSRRRIKWLQPKWWDKECECLKVVKYNALKRFKDTDKLEDFSRYKNARKDLKNCCISKKNIWKDGLRQKLISSKYDPVKFWNTIKSINRSQLHIATITAVE